MIKVEDAWTQSMCDACGKKWQKGFKKVHVMGGGRYIVITFVLCGDCLKLLKEMA